jgi:hypothetical protein
MITNIAFSAQTASRSRPHFPPTHFSLNLQDSTEGRGKLRSRRKILEHFISLDSAETTVTFRKPDAKSHL